MDGDEKRERRFALSFDRTWDHIEVVVVMMLCWFGIIIGSRGALFHRFRLADYMHPAC